MTFFTQFVQRVIHDLNLKNLTPSVKKTLELRVGEIIDEQIEEALANSLTEKDWKTLDEYQTAHPDAPEDAALQEVIGDREEVKTAVENAFVAGYDDLMGRAEAVRETLDGNSRLGGD